MRCPWASAFLVALAAPLAAQSGGVRELGLQAVATAAEPAAYTAGFTAAIRPAGRLRLALFAGGGVSGGEGVGRAELVAHFLLNPRSTALAWYGGGGIAGVFGSGQDAGYMVVLLGVDWAPGGAGGWFAEAGVGGGARVSVGYRWRRLPAGWRAGG